MGIDKPNPESDEEIGSENNEVSNGQSHPRERWSRTSGQLRELEDELRANGLDDVQIAEEIPRSAIYQEGRAEYVGVIENIYNTFLLQYGPTKVSDLRDFAIRRAQFQEFLQNNGFPEGNSYEGPVSHYHLGYRFNIDTLIDDSDPFSIEVRDRVKNYLLGLQPCISAVGVIGMPASIQTKLTQQFLKSWDDKEKLDQTMKFYYDKSDKQSMVFRDTVRNPNATARHVLNLVEQHHIRLSDAGNNSNIARMLRNFFGYNGYRSDLGQTVKFVDSEPQTVAEEMASQIDVNEDFFDGKVSG